MIKIIIDKLISKMIDSREFNSYVKNMIIKTYKEDSLHAHRVWGDETKLNLGDNVQVNDALINTLSGEITIGDDSFFGHGVCLLTGYHDYKKKGIDRIKSVPVSGRDIFIGKGVWIGSKAIVLGPCEIGDYSVIAAASVVSGKVDAYSVYAGAPAKFVKKINFD